MIRARSAFEVCKNTEQALHTAEMEEGMDMRQIYAEDQVPCFLSPASCLNSSQMSANTAFGIVML